MRYGKIAVVGSIFFCLISSIAFWNFIHNSTQQKILRLDLERQKMLQINNNILNYKSKYGNLDEYMKTIEKRYQLASISLPDRMQQGEFVTFLQQVAFENQIKITSLIPSSIQIVEDDENKSDTVEKTSEIDNPLDKKTQEKNLTLKKLSIVVKIESGYVQLIKFLKAIESSERLVRIDNLAIISKDSGDNLNCELQLSIFSLE